VSFALRVVTGSRAGERELFDKAAVVLGRHSQCDVRFDAKLDLDVSARHAEIRHRHAATTLRDLGSTNGTFVNGERVRGERELRSGDVISLGEMGPQLEIAIDNEPHVVSAPRVEIRRRFPRVRVGMGLFLVASLSAAYWLGRGDSRARDARVEALVRRTDSLNAVYTQDLARMSGQVAGLETALRAVRDERERLRGELERARSDASSGPSVDLLASRLQTVETRREAILSASRVDYSAIAERNGPAVVLIAVEWADGKTFTGTGFSVTTSGTLITNRHLVANESGERPRRILVIFSDTKVWLPARFVRASREADLALLQVEVAGPFPVVAGVSPSSTSARVGTPVALIGYPLGVDTPMDGSGQAITARSTLGAGTVSKTLANIVQIDAFAGEGSSGSPVFDGDGQIIAVVYGGARESAGRIVYAVPSERLAAFLPPSASGLLR
jgi:S1-C subfamily serine protease